MPSTTFNYTAAVAARLQAAGIDKDEIISMVRNRVVNFETQAADATESAKVEAAQEAHQTAIDAAQQKADSEIVLT